MTITRNWKKNSPGTCGNRKSVETPALGKKKWNADSGTGDGAILVFDSAQDAHRFAQAVHEATFEHNRTRAQPLAKRVFRIGIASGEIVMVEKPGGVDIAGTTIARAVRLEAKAQPGGVLVDKTTFEALETDQKQHYGPKETVAGKRDEALNIAATVQDAMRERAPELLSDADANVSDGVTELALELNRTVMQAAGGVRPAPAFVGCLDEQFGLLHYVNAGHTPAFIRINGEITQLDSTGLPLGLFTHSTHDAHVSVAQSGSSIVLVSKGLVEVSAGRQEFAVERVRRKLQEENFGSAQELCHSLLDSAVKFAEQPSAFGPQFSITGFRSSHEANDLTVVCLMRMAQAAAAA